MAFDQAIADKVCEALREGDCSLRKVCRDLGVSHSTVLEWAQNDTAGFADQYARARDLATDAEFEGLNDLSDEPPDRGPDGKVDQGWVAWQKQRIDARKWGWARRAPKKYGDKIQTEHSGNVGLTVAATKLDESL